MNKSAIKKMFETVSLGSPENAVGFVLWRVFHRYQREIDRALAPVGLTHLQFTTLTLVAWLSRSDDAVTQAELSRFGDIHPMQLSLMLKALEQKLLISRVASSEDVRAKHVILTLPGLAMLRKTLPVVIAVQKEMFGEDGACGGGLLELLLKVDHTGH